MDALTLNRKIFTDKSTIGDLYFKGEKICDTLEDTCRGIKIPTITAIPAGRYELVLAPSPKFNRVMPRLLNVPGYSGILIHWGNTPDDTDGCILVGTYDEQTPDFISSSHKTFDILFLKLESIRDEDLFITITGGYPRLKDSV